MKNNNTQKRKQKSVPLPHRYFLVGRHPGVEMQIVVFKHGKDGTGQSVFEHEVSERAWWYFCEMESMNAIEIPAAILKRTLRLYR